MRCLMVMCRARGATLVEVLVALVIVSVGMLGVATLTVQALRIGHNALLHTQVATLVSDIADRIRANPAAGEAYHCARYPGGPSERNCAPSAASPLGSNCTAAELAEDDLARWLSLVRRSLPLASSEPCAADVAYVPPTRAGDPTRYRVSVAWLQRGDSAASTYVADVLLMPPATSQ